MSDDVKTPVVDPAIVEPTKTEQPAAAEEEKKTVVTDDVLLTLKEELRAEAEENKSFYLDKLEIAKKQIGGLDKKNSELQRKINEYERKEMTEAEKYELEKRELAEERAKLNKELAIAKYQLIADDTDDIDFADYLRGESKEEVFEKTERLKNYLDKKIAAGIEKGVEARLAQGYKPNAASVNGDKKNSFEDMTKQELIEKAKEVSKMPSGEDKTALLKLLSKEQERRWKT